MTDVSSGLGTFIPNNGDYPKALTLAPSERAKFLAEKAVSEEQARETARKEDVRKADAPKDDEQKGDKSAESEFAPSIGNLGKNVSIDV
jgi:hypothetical protein